MGSFIHLDVLKIEFTTAGFPKLPPKALRVHLLLSIGSLLFLQADLMGGLYFPSLLFSQSDDKLASAHMAKLGHSHDCVGAAE